MIAAETEAAAQVQMPARAVVGIAEFIGQLLEIFEDTHSPALYSLAVFGQGDAAAGAVQQARGQGGFEDLNALAHIRRRQPQFIGGGCEAGLADHGEEHPQVFG